MSILAITFIVWFFYHLQIHTNCLPHPILLVKENLWLVKLSVIISAQDWSSYLFNTWKLFLAQETPDMTRGVFL